MSEVERSMAEIRRLLAEIARAHPSLHGSLAKVHQELDRLAHALESGPAVPKKRTGESTLYRVEAVNSREVLGEYRPSASPLRVGRDIYDAVVQSLSQSERPLGVDEALTAIVRAVDTPPAEWQIRVVLRYMLRGDPPFVARNRSRYHPLNNKTFRKAAANWWESGRSV
jgi:hypothetical protein